MKQPHMHYRDIAAVFLKTGSSSFGGWSSTALQLEKELVDRRALLTSRDIKSAVTYAQIVPGATQVALVAHAGYRLRGTGGAMIATASYLLPAICLVTLFAAVYFHSLQQTPHLAERLDGLIAALAGIILANAYRIGGRHATHIGSWVFVAISVLAIFLLHIHALVVLAAYGIIGLCISLSRGRKKEPTG